MAWFGTTSNVVQKGSRGIGFIRKIYITIFLILLFTVLINAISISIAEKDIKPGLEYLGNKFLKPTHTLSEESKKIVENGSVSFKDSGNFIKNFWNTLLVYTSLISSILAIFLWLFILARIIAWSPLSNISNVFINWTLAIIFFLGAQMLLLAVNGLDIMIPINALIDFINAVPILANPFEGFMGGSSDNNITISSINQSIHNIAGNVSNLTS